MSYSTNPFLRGYSQLSVRRSLVIEPYRQHGLEYRPVHPIQAQYSDSELQFCYSKFNNEFALVPERDALPERLLSQCPRSGFIVGIVYTITGCQGHSGVHLGDAHSSNDAHRVVRQLSFETGRYNRCWEISSRHLSRLDRKWLWMYIRRSVQPPDVLFDAFELREGAAFGIRLLETPWTDENLRSTRGIDSSALHRGLEERAIPAALIRILEQAALADTRILIFDPDAPALIDLPLPCLHSSNPDSRSR